MDERNKNSTQFSPPHLESHIIHASLSAKGITGLDTPCGIHIHSLRHRLTDPDGISGKAVIDGLVHAGVFTDDTTEQIKEITFSQEKIGKTEEEKTIITIKGESVPKRNTKGEK